MPSLSAGNQSADCVAAAAKRLHIVSSRCVSCRGLPAAFDHMEEGELFGGMDGEGGVRSREADLLPLLLHHRRKQLPHLYT